MPRGFGLAVAAGLSSAVVFLTAVVEQGLSVLLFYLVALPLVMVGLSRGLASAMIASAVGCAAVAAVQAAALPVFGVAAVVPALVVVRQGLLYRLKADGGIAWYPPGQILGWLTGAAVAMLMAAAVLAGGQGGSLEDLVRQNVGGFVDQMGGTIPVELRDRLVAWWTALLPALLAGMWLLMAALNGWLGQWALGRLGMALRPQPPLADLDPPLWVALGVAAALVLGLLAGGGMGYLGRNLVVLLLVPYLLAGLAAVHRNLSRRPHGGMLLTAFYMAFFVFSGWSQMGVAGLGLVRHWTRLRRQDAGGGQEEK